MTPTTRLARARKPSKVQRDVIGRLRDGWVLTGGLFSYVLVKEGEPSRHVANSTVSALVRRDVIQNDGPWSWRLA